MVKKLALGVAGIMLLAACNQELFEVLNRTVADPFTEVPAVVSFKESNTIFISWSNDDAADEYILKRALDGSQILYEEIYRGTVPYYEDRGLPDQNMYLYCLAKKRGDKEFPLSEPAMGVSSLVTRDVNEENDAESAATHLGDTPVISNMHYYRSYSGFILQDEDWYYTEIPPGWQISVIINDSKAPANRLSHFMLYIKDRDTARVTSDGEIQILNSETSPLRCYLKVYPYEYLYISEMPETEIGGGMVLYTIKISMKLASNV
jgi:hypothetical protein